MVGEARAHVQGESLKARAALHVRLINSPIARAEGTMKMYLFAAAIGVAACVPMTAQADLVTPGFYSAASFTAYWPDYHTAGGTLIGPNTLTGGEADIGYRFNRYYAVEGGYTYADGNNTILGNSVDLWGFCLSAIVRTSRCLARLVRPTSLGMAASMVFRPTDHLVRCVSAEVSSIRRHRNGPSAPVSAMASRTSHRSVA
jgi:hypothetical protein